MTADDLLLKLQHEHHKVPVTALRFYGEDILLSGEGTRIVAYSAVDRSSICSAQVFQGQAVHGILAEPHTGVILVFGGSHVAIAHLDQASATRPNLTITHTTDIGDWILDAAVRPSSAEDALINATLITAHNSLVECTFPTSGSQVATSKTLSPGSNCILYTAHITWLSASHCLIASGTAFGDVILWSFFPPVDASASARTQTHFTFSAHEGSVFGVHISPNLSENLLGGRTSALATCSDDRTVRVWDISDLSTESPSLVDIQRDTGFGAKQEADALAPPPLAKAMGHVSRIWHVRFVRTSSKRRERVSTSSADGLKVLSFGEDATRITWDIISQSTAAGKPAFALQQVHVQSLHSGKNIWAVASDDQRCATGGSDGSIAILSPFSKQPAVHEVAKDLLNPSYEDVHDFRSDPVKSYALINGSTAVATTVQGSILMLRLYGDGSTDVQCLAADQSLKGYSMVTGTHGYVYVAGAEGNLLGYSDKTKGITNVAILAGKAAGLFIGAGFQRLEDTANIGQTLLVTAVGARSAELYGVNKGMLFGAMQHHGGKNYWRLGLGPGFIITSFALLAVEGQEFAVLGSRSSQLAIYRIGYHESLLPSDISHQVHGKDAITDLLVASGTNGITYLYSTGRDGTYAIHRASTSASRLSLTLVHQVELPFGPNIEGLAITPDSHLRVWGFRSKHFVAHNVTSQRDIMAVECGGAHRNWAYYPSHSGGTVVWTKASQVMWTSQGRPACQSINAGGHGREIKAVAVSSGERQLIATGAEDTDIKLFSYGEEGELRCLQTLRKHNTGIQHLQWSGDGSYLFSSGGFEEFYVWRVCHDVPWVGVGVVCESRHPSSGTSDLRVMGFNVHELSPAEGSERAFEAVMAYSDTSLKTWRYTAGEWQMLASGDYLTACLSNVISLDPGEDNSKHARLLTTATDGHLATWQQSSDKTLEWHSRHKVHQNAILDTLVQPLSDGSRLVFTAGDDNGIGITRVGRDNAVSPLLIPRAHASAVTTLVVKQMDDGVFWLVSASVDQRVKLSEVRIDEAADGVTGVSVKKLHDVFTSVADVSSASLIRLQDGGTGVLICGVGMDVWRLPS